MPSKIILSYEVGWKPNEDKGILKVNIDGDVKSTVIKTKSIEEINLLINILRHEKPVYLSLNGWIHTGKEAIGEGDD